MSCLSVIHIPRTKTLRAVILVALALSAGALFAEGQVFWQQGGVSVRDSTFYYDLQMVPDGSGGAIVIWTDNRREPMDRVIYAQRVDSSGTKLWPDSGLAVCQPLELAGWPAAEADGAGGVVMAWEVGDICLRAQCLDADGTRPWGESSAVVFDTSGVELDLEDWGMCSDGQGGCVVAWAMGYFHGSDSIVLRAQYMDSLGRRAWGARGRRIARDLALYGSVRVVALGSQGFVLTWICDNDEIFAQRLDAAGNEVWTALVCSGVPVHGYPTIVRTNGGMLVCWIDLRNGDRDVYAQKLDLAGNPLWALNGVPVCRAAGQQGGGVNDSGNRVQAAGLPDGGALVAFYDQGRGRTAVSCQRVSADGNMMWDSTGVEAGRISDKDTLFTTTWFGFVSDTTGGAIVTWPRYRRGDSSQIWAQHLNAAGSACWDSGVFLSECAVYHELSVFRTTTDCRNGAIGCWEDWRFGGPHAGIYAQRYGDGPTSLAEPRVNLPIAAQWMCPSPLRAGATISLPQCGAQSASFDLLDPSGRKVMDLHPGANDVRALAPGVYFVREAQAQAIHKVVLTR